MKTTNSKATTLSAPVVAVGLMMRFPVSKRTVVLSGLLLVEILSLTGVTPQGMGLLAIRLGLVLGFLGLLAWEFVRHARVRRPKQNPQASPADEKDLAILYHEIRNCTSTLKGNAYLLKQQMTCEKDRAPVERIERAAASIERIAREVLILSEPGRLEPAVMLDLPGLINECAEDHFPACLDAIHVECRGIPPKIGGDPGKLRQAFVNLFKNSFEAEAGNIWVQIAPAGKFLRILIEDDGTGCPHGDLRKIFLPMQTSKREKGGQGIGLALVKAIVEGHGGCIWASARKGARAPGLAMHITLPIAPAPLPGMKAEGALPEAMVV